MIDTDKYEGHTLDEAWVEIYDERYDDWRVSNLPAASSNGGICGINEPTAHLIADAPLLLAEVKRLRERLDLAESYIIEPTLIRNYFADVVSKGLVDESDNLG